jgi:hypothetical protein
MSTYRYYCLDGVRHLHGADWFDAENDHEAVAFVREKHPDGRCEVWDGKRLVAESMPELRQV